MSTGAWSVTMDFGLWTLDFGCYGVTVAIMETKVHPVESAGLQDLTTNRDRVRC